MILCPPGWREWRAGDVLMYSPREGRLDCVMTYQERVTPLRSFPALLQDVLAEDPEFQLVEKSRIRRFVTDEGEYGARIVARGTYHGRPIGHVLASVFADDFCTQLSARATAEHLDEYTALVEDLSMHDRLGLGVRRRRVGFTPPKGWHPSPGFALEIALLPPDYPRIHASITVYPAEPWGFDPHQYQRVHDERVGLPPGEELEQLARTAAWKGGKPLEGSEWRSRRSLPGDAGKMLRCFVVLKDERYVYAAKLEAMEDDHFGELHEAFVQTVGSIEPIPQPLGKAGHDSVFAIWNE